MAEALHGGRVHAAARELGLAPEAILDFSANLNPLGPPPGVFALLRQAGPELVCAYPDLEAPALRATLGARHGVPAERLVLGAGGAALLFLALRALAPERVLVPRPCFREQPRAVAACGAQLREGPMPGLRLDLDGLDGLLDPEARDAQDAPSCAGRLRTEPPDARPCDAVLITNPHNPTGQLLPPGPLEAWIQAHPRTAVVVDEAFMDYGPDQALPARLLDRPRTVVLRSLTKFYAMPGLRVGYALADPATARRMAALQEGWPVGELELRAAQAALADPDHARRTLSAFRQDAPAFVQGLRALGLRPLPSAGPFVLLPLPGSGADLARSLRPRGILVRTCAEWPGLGDTYVRLALRGRPDWAPLFQGLADWLGALPRP